MSRRTPRKPQGLTKVPARTVEKPSDAGPETSDRRTEDAEPTEADETADRPEPRTLGPAALVPLVSARSASIFLADAVEEMADVAATNRTGLGNTIGTVALNKAGMRVLLTKQTNKAENGLWEVRAGEWAQCAPAVTSGGILVFVLKGLAWFRPAETDFGTATSNWTKLA